MKKSSNDGILPSLYIPHGGGPCFFMDWTMGPADTWKKMQDWLASVKNTLPQKPAGVVIVSGHWEAKEFTVNAHKNPELLYDYYGFPEHTYSIKYPAPGSPGLAEEVMALLEKKGIKAASESKRGLDHGVFIPLKVMFPDADIPVVQLSMKTGLNPDMHMDAGRALAPLRQKGILILGSGNSFHNLNLMMSGRVIAEADEFEYWLDDHLAAPPIKRIEALRHWSDAPAARLAHPREDHLLPLMVVSGAAEESVGKLVFRDRVMGYLNSAWQFGG